VEGLEREVQELRFTDTGSGFRVQSLGITV